MAIAIAATTRGGRQQLLLAITTSTIAYSKYTQYHNYYFSIATTTTNTMTMTTCYAIASNNHCYCAAAGDTNGEDYGGREWMHFLVAIGQLPSRLVELVNDRIRELSQAPAATRGRNLPRAERAGQEFNIGLPIEQCNYEVEKCRPK